MRYPYWIVELEELRPEHKEFARLKGIPVSFMRKVSGAKRRRTQKFDNEDKAKQCARLGDSRGASVELWKVESPRAHRKRESWR